MCCSQHAEFDEILERDGEQPLRPEGGYPALLRCEGNTGTAFKYYHLDIAGSGGASRRQPNTMAKQA